MRVMSRLNKMWLYFSLILFSVSALVVVFPAVANAEAMSWTPRTPAGGRDFVDPNFFLRVAGVVEWGSLSIFNTAAEVETTTTTTAEAEVTQGESRVYSPIGRFGVTLEGELVLIDSEGNSMQKGPTQSLAFDNSINQYFYFTPQMTSSTTTVTQKSKPKKDP